MDWMIRKDIRGFLEEDLGYGDITTGLFEPSTSSEGKEMIKAEITAKEELVVSGLNEAAVVFDELGAETKILFKAGEQVEEGEILMVVKGDISSLLSAERLALNIIMRMSGIATKVHRMVDEAGDTAIAATRKTTPGFRRFEKKAVEDGGGDTHRFRLDDMVLIKDNHIRAAGGVEEALERAKKASFSKKVDIEVTSMDEAMTAAENGADIIMLDNMEPEEVKEIYQEIKKIDEGILVEVSGGIDETNFKDYVGRADIISSGSITHSVDSADVSMNIVDVSYRSGE
ncbi:MAG: carboxylating nicotinate-nucleotide diphosphorylase [Thermoplasmatota archaeon]